MARSGNSKLVKDDPFASRTPRDFFGRAATGTGTANGWPNGGFRRLLSQEADELPAGPDKERALAQAETAENAVRGLAQLVRELNRWMADARLTQEQAAEQLGVTPQRLSRLRTGAGWPRWDIVVLIQTNLNDITRARLEAQVRQELTQELRRR